MMKKSVKIEKNTVTTVLQNIYKGKYDAYRYSDSDAMRTLERSAIKDTLKTDLELHFGVPHNFVSAQGLFDQAWSIVEQIEEAHRPSGFDSADAADSWSIDMYQRSCYDAVFQVYESLFRAVILPILNQERSNGTLSMLQE